MRGESRVVRLSRRRLLAGAAGLVAAVTAPVARPAQTRRRWRRVDVAVVSAGLAGLSAARELRRSGLSVVVLEARGRVGGRAKRQAVAGGTFVDVGGQWVGPTQGPGRASRPGRAALLGSAAGWRSSPTR